MVVAQLCVRTVSGGFKGTLTNQTNAYRHLLSNSLGSMSGQLCFTSKRCRSLTCKSSGGSFGWRRSSNHADGNRQDLLVPDMSLATNEPKGAGSKNSTQSQVPFDVSQMERKRVLAERNQLREEVTRKSEEIDKLKETIHLALHHLSLAVDFPKENILPNSTIHAAEKTSKNSSEGHKRKADHELDDDLEEARNKRPRLESNNNPIQETAHSYCDDD